VIRHRFHRTVHGQVDAPEGADRPNATQKPAAVSACADPGPGAAARVAGLGLARAADHPVPLGGHRLHLQR
jgi:hypothetical protein